MGRCRPSSFKWAVCFDVASFHFNGCDRTSQYQAHMKIFVSYSHRQSDEAEAIVLSLQGYRHDVFFDRERLKPGQGYDQRIHASIRQADLFVFLISPDSVSPRSYALSELGMARQKWEAPENKVLPVEVVPTPMEDIPQYLRAVTILRAEGNLAAEVSAAVSRLGYRGYSTDSTMDSDPHPPSFLAYMVNRDAQRVQIRQTIPDPASGTQDRVVVYLTYGLDNELHKSIAERYVNYTLPRHVQRPDDSFSDTRKSVNWPATSLDETTRFDSILRDILCEFSLMYTGKIDDIQAHFKNQFEPFLMAYRKSPTICVNIQAEDWDEQANRVFAGLLECFARIDVPTGCLVTLFFQVKLRQPKAGLFRMFSRSKPSTLDAFISGLRSNGSVEGKASLGVVCLPELQPVTKVDVERWATVTAPSVYATINTEALKQEATRPFEDTSEKPYESIIGDLRGALHGANK